MNNLNLSSYGVNELNSSEAILIDGGGNAPKWLHDAIDWVWDLFD